MGASYAPSVGYIDVNGLHTYYEEHGSGDALLLLHGGLADADSFAQQTPILAERYRVILPERRGHGRTPDVAGPITYEVMADDTIAFMDALGTGAAHLVGWSDGGNVGLLVAIKRPDLVDRLVIMGSNFSAAGLLPAAVAAFTPDTPTTIVPMMRDMWQASAVHPEQFDVVLEKMERCWNDYEIRLDDLAGIAAPTLVMVGDDDIMSLEHTVVLYETIPYARLAIVPGASHLAPVEQAELVNQLILEVLDSDASPSTLMPLRRR
jgi:pimeloyl-ACP methyl ester carboxylesterase